MISDKSIEDEESKPEEDKEKRFTRKESPDMQASNAFSSMPIDSVQLDPDEVRRLVNAEMKRSSTDHEQADGQSEPNSPLLIGESVQ